MSAENASGAESVLKEWNDDRARRVRKSIKHPERRADLEPGDVQHTLCINKGELVLQVEYGNSIEYVWPTPAKGPDEDFVAKSAHDRFTDEFTLLLTAEELQRRLAHDWSILTHEETAVERPERAMGGDA